VSTLKRVPLAAAPTEHSGTFANDREQSAHAAAGVDARSFDKALRFG
jgi:hypothetical protein